MGSLSRSLSDAGANVQYDMHVKRILSNKDMLAWILKGAVREFRPFPVEQIRDHCIGEDIWISQIPTEPGGERITGNRMRHPGFITGDRNEDGVPNEGRVYFDIRFHAWVPKPEGIIKIIMNLEAQKLYYPGYEIVTRGIYYGARMLSAQLGTEFSGSDYDGLKKVYSIWICMNAPDYIGNAISEYHMVKKDLIKGVPDKKEAYDKLSVVLLCLNTKLWKEEKNRQKEDWGEEQEERKLLYLLGSVLEPKLSCDEKRKILEEQFQIDVEDVLGKEIGQMCNLSEAIEEEGIRKGIKKGINKGIKLGVQALIETCRELGLTREQTLAKLQQKFLFSDETAGEYMNAYWK